MKPNMMNMIYRGFAAAFTVCAMLVAGSCTGKFESYNTDHNAAQEVDLRTLITTMEMDAVIACSDEGANAFQRAQNLMGDTYSGYMAPIDAFEGGMNTTTYALNATDWNNVPFSVTFTNVMPAWLQLRYAHENGMLPDDTFAIAEVIRILALHRTSDIYGPLPIKNFGQVNNPYDAEEENYKQFFADLDLAIAVLKSYAESAPNARPLSKVDAVYGGDYTKWLKLANSLKLRLAMRIVYADEALAKRYAQEAVAGGVMESADESAMLASMGSIQVFNPLEEVWNAYDDTRMGATMDAYLNGYEDPRLPKYFQPSAKDGAYHGVRSGLSTALKENYNILSAPNVQKSTPVRWFMASEAAFLRAEGALRQWNMNGNAKDLYERGIELSFLENELTASAAATYAANDVRKPTSFVDASASGTKYDYGAPSQITIKWNEGAGFEEKLERIITQKWIAMYPNGQEAWSEFRRTGYPKVIPIASNRSNGDVDTYDQVRRMTFPRSEYANNPNGVKRAVRLLGGDDKGSTKLWWDKK